MPVKHITHKPVHHRRGLPEAEKVILVKSGSDYFDRVLDIINRSKLKLHLQTYIFLDDSTGKMVIAALQNAVERGVKVTVLIDAFGSHSLKKEAIDVMQKSNIQFRTFSPLFVNHRMRFGRRLHHKILVADEKEALIGGINIEDKYRLKKDNHTPWLDYAVYLSGPVCEYVDSLCEATWKGRFYRKWRKHHHHNHEHKKGIAVWIRQNDWMRKKDGISRSLRYALKHSHESINIIGSYFLPGRRVRKLLKVATERNVKIRLILQGASDVNLVKNASSWWYAWLLRNNIEIYEWSKTVLHGKLMLVDKNWASIGSYNINHLSDYASIDANVEVHDKTFCSTVHDEVERIINASERVSVSEYRHKVKLFGQFMSWISFHIVRVLFWLQFLLLSKE
jgi:cardiolipin synthase